MHPKCIEDVVNCIILLGFVNRIKIVTVSIFCFVLTQRSTLSFSNCTLFPLSHVFSPFFTKKKLRKVNVIQPFFVQTSFPTKCCRNNEGNISSDPKSQETFSVVSDKAAVIENLDSRCLSLSFALLPHPTSTVQQNSLAQTSLMAVV